MWNKSAEELRAALTAPFQSADIEWRVSATNSAKTSGLAVPYPALGRMRSKAHPAHPNFSGFPFA